MPEFETIKSGWFVFPLVTQERFAELSGVPEGVVRGWISKGTLPTMKVGRWRLVNLKALFDLDAEAEAEL